MSQKTLWSNLQPKLFRFHLTQQVAAPRPWWQPYRPALGCHTFMTHIFNSLDGSLLLSGGNLCCANIFFSLNIIDMKHQEFNVEQSLHQVVWCSTRHSDVNIVSLLEGGWYSEERRLSKWKIIYGLGSVGLSGWKGWAITVSKRIFHNFIGKITK